MNSLRLYPLLLLVSLIVLHQPVHCAEQSAECKAAELEMRIFLDKGGLGIAFFKLLNKVETKCGPDKQAQFAPVGPGTLARVGYEDSLFGVCPLQRLYLISAQKRICVVSDE